MIQDIDKLRRGIITVSTIAAGVVLGVLPACRKAKSKIPPDVAARAWEDQVMIPGALIMSVPWQLKARSDPRMPPNTAIWVGEQFDSAISATTIAGAADVPMDLLADGGIKGVADLPGFRLLSSEKREASLLGKPALDFSARYARSNDELLTNGVVLLTETHSVMAALLYAADDEVGPPVWARLRAGLRA
jgi:hypothetical protein